MRRLRTQLHDHCIIVGIETTAHDELCACCAPNASIGSRIESLNACAAA
jgi:hypothetical protein